MQNHSKMFGIIKNAGPLKLNDPATWGVIYK